MSDRQPRPGDILIVFHRNATAEDNFKAGRFIFNHMSKMQKIPAAAKPKGPGPMTFAERSHEVDRETWLSPDLLYVTTNGLIFGRCAKG